MEYTIQRISRHNLKHLLPLFLAAFNKKSSEAELLKKYDTDFLGVSYLGFIAFDHQGEAAAYYGVFPTEAIVAGKKHLIVQSGDTMTHPKHQGKGLFIKLANQTYQLCAEEKIQAVFGFPSQSSYNGFVKKLQWSHHENIQQYTIWVYTFPIAEMASRVKMFRDVYHSFVKYVFSRCARGTPFLSSNLGGGDILHRSPDFWEYKLRCDSNKLINLSGINLVVKISSVMGIGDCDAKNLHDFKKMLRKLRILSFFTGINRIMFYVSPGTRMDDFLKAIKKPSTGLAIGYRNFDSSVDLSSMKFSYFDFDTF